LARLKDPGNAFVIGVSRLFSFSVNVVPSLPCTAPPQICSFCLGGLLLWVKHRDLFVSRTTRLGNPPSHSRSVFLEAACRGLGVPIYPFVCSALFLVPIHPYTVRLYHSQLDYELNPKLVSLILAWPENIGKRDCLKRRFSEQNAYDFHMPFLKCLGWWVLV